MKENKQVIPKCSRKPIPLGTELSGLPYYHRTKTCFIVTLTHLFNVSLSGSTENKTKG